MTSSVSDKTEALRDPPAIPSAPSSVRERILGTASALFYREGIHAVGVDAIVAASGVAKMSFYRHFPSKDHLIRAVLELQDRRYWAWWDEAVARHPGAPREQLRALFESIGEKFHHPTYRGCAFVNFTAEFAQAGHPGFDVVTANKRQQRERLRAMTGQLGAADPDLLADQLVLLMEGARVSALTLGDSGPARQLSRAVDSLVAAHLAQRPSSE
jgi:AcrR family transcriptional regulator